MTSEHTNATQMQIVKTPTALTLAPASRDTQAMAFLAQRKTKVGNISSNYKYPPMKLQIKFIGQYFLNDINFKSFFFAFCLSFIISNMDHFNSLN